MSVFISYAGQDEEVAARLAKDLKSFDIDVWFDKERLLPGRSWVEEVESSIREASAVLVLFSSHSSASDSFQGEVVSAISQSLSSTPKVIIPVLLEKDVRLPPFLRDFNYVDLGSPAGYERNVERIVEALKTAPETLPSSRERYASMTNFATAQREALTAAKAQHSELSARRSISLAAVMGVAGVLVTLTAGLISINAYEIPKGFIGNVIAFFLGVGSSILATYLYERLRRRADNE